MKITKEKLRELYKDNPNYIVCQELGITKGTLIRLLERNNIVLKGKGWRDYSIRPRFKIEVLG